MQAKRSLRVGLPRRIGRCVAAALLAASLLLVLSSTPASASGIDGTGNWVDATVYFGGGVGVPTAANHDSSTHVEYYYVDSYHRVVYWENFSGSVRPYPHPLCGDIDWIKSSTYYETADGNVTIGDWYSTGALCPTDSICHGYRSDTDYWLNCTTCTGRLNSWTWFTNECLPNSSSNHTTSVSF